MKYLFLSIALISIILTSVISLIPLWWVTQGDISNMYSTSITPAGFTFSIWSLIYLSWIVLGLHTFIARKTIWKKYLYLAGTMFLSVIWLLPWHFDIIGLSLIVMLILFTSLVYLYLRKEKYHDRYFQYTLELYLWWIFVAFIANIHIFLVSVNWYIMPDFLTIVSLFIWFFVLLYTLKVKQSFIPSYVFLWALFGIYIAQESIFIHSWVMITTASLLLIIWCYHPKTVHILR